MSDACKEFELPSRVSREDLKSLQTFLRTHSDKPVVVSARQWRTFDTLTVQFLLAVSRSWSDRGQHFSITDVSAETAGILEQIGVRPDLLNWEEAR